MFRIDTDDLSAAQDRLQKLSKKTPYVAVRAVNKAMTGVKTDMVKVARADYNYKSTALRKRIKVQKANIANISGFVQSKGGQVHLTDVAGTRETKKGVSVNVKKSTGRQIIEKAFIAHGKNSGKEIVFQRKTKNGVMVPRYPIKAISTAHPEIIYNTNEVWKKLAGSISERLNKNINREIDAEYRKQAGKW